MAASGAIVPAATARARGVAVSGAMVPHVRAMAPILAMGRREPRTRMDPCGDRVAGRGNSVAGALALRGSIGVTYLQSERGVALSEFAELDMWTVTQFAALVSWVCGFFVLCFLSPLEEERS